ncbi:unnamed protein product [Brachionus calyciflorus]|uniref:Uncharacterized protein n=1 Tax=Brachionus calyciflorus TaxID=104777 RepID=A0A813VKN9_9BILA|nr:unnamed protein product [Brachionus calyciflorus]
MIKNPSLHSSISSTKSDKLPKKKINFIEKNKQNLSNKKLNNEDVDVIQINCLNDLNTITRSRDTNPSPISSSSIEIFEQIETIETNDPSYLIQGGQNFEIDDNVYISSNNHYDKSKIRSEFSKILKKREITPNIIETTTSSIDSGLETMTLKAQSDLDLKLNSVMKQLEVLKLYEQNIVPKLLEKRLESNEFDSSRIKHIEQVQENQFKLMSQLIEKIKPFNSSLNNIEEPRVKTIQFNDKIEVMETSRKSTKSRSRSRGSRKKDNSCEVCIRRSKSPPVKKEKQFLQELIETLPKSPNCSFKEDDLLKEKVNYFDDYLTRKNTENLSEILKQSNELLSELERQEEIKSNRVKEEMVKKANKPSMFSDIKDILKKVEISKNKIDTFMNEIDRKKNTKMFYLLNENDKDEELRIKKLVDGCINAISNDVQKVVTQKMIDESRHIKLEAEKDINSKSKNRNSRISQRSVSTTNLTNVKKPKQISDVHKFLGKIYGKSLLDQIKQEEIEEKKQRLKQDNQQQQQQQQQKKEPIKQKQQQQMILNRPAFSTVQFQTYPENTIKKFNYKSTDTISMVTIIPREQSQEKVSNMTRQVLPSMSINPAKLNTNNNKKINVKTIEIKENFDESEKEEQGSGIELTGHGKEETKQNNILPTITEPVNQNFFIDRALRENRVLDWLEQEILKSFLNRIRIEEQEQEDNEEYNEQSIYFLNFFILRYRLNYA